MNSMLDMLSAAWRLGRFGATATPGVRHAADSECASASHETPRASYSPHLQMVKRDDVIRHEVRSLLNDRADDVQSPTFLDIGGRKGEYRCFANGFDYWLLDIAPGIEADQAIQADICHTSDLPDQQFDVVFSNNVFEHLLEPWLAAENCVRLTKLGGLLIHIAPFSWRYHPVPVDCFRYSHTGLANLFTRTGLVKTIVAGYDISKRRRDFRGGKLEGGLDIPPTDELGGWRENWLTVFVGQRSE